MLQHSYSLLENWLGNISTVEDINLRLSTSSRNLLASMLIFSFEAALDIDPRLNGRELDPLPLRGGRQNCFLSCLSAGIVDDSVDNSMSRSSILLNDEEDPRNH